MISCKKIKLTEFQIQEQLCVAMLKQAKQATLEKAPDSDMYGKRKFAREAYNSSKLEGSRLLLENSMLSYVFNTKI